MEKLLGKVESITMWHVKYTSKKISYRKIYMVDVNNFIGVQFFSLNTILAKTSTITSNKTIEQVYYIRTCLR